jgi:ribose transport system substrate-binding protein
MKKMYAGWAVLAAVLGLSLGSCQKGPTATGTNTAAANTKSKKYSVGFTIQNLSNPTWGGTAEELNRLITEDGGEFTYMDTRNPNTQIQQVENFISKGVDVIIIHVTDPNSLENVLGQARKAGIKVYSWDTNLENSDLNWLISNYELGSVIGEWAADWINEKFGGAAEYAVLNYDTEQILLERANGIRETMARLVPNAAKVADQSAVTAMEAQAAIETVLQANPNLKVIASIGGGGAIGANNAVKAAGKLTPDFGIFAADATDLEIQAIENDEAIRMSVMISGSPKANAKIIFDLVKAMISDKSMEKNVLRELIPITKENTNLTK